MAPVKPYRAFAVSFRAFCLESRIALVPAISVSHFSSMQSLMLHPTHLLINLEVGKQTWIFECKHIDIENTEMFTCGVWL